MANQPAGRMQVGLVLPIAEDQALGGVPRYALIRDWALRAEALGFDSIWVYDHLLFRDGQPDDQGAACSGAGRGDQAGATWHDRHVRAVPQPGGAGQDGRHAR